VILNPSSAASAGLNPDILNPRPGPVS
jgi:hypothetical protein